MENSNLKSFQETLDSEDEQALLDRLNRLNHLRVFAPADSIRRIDSYIEMVETQILAVSFNVELQ